MKIGKRNLKQIFFGTKNFDFITKGLKFVGRFGYDSNNQNTIRRLEVARTMVGNVREIPEMVN